MSNCSEIDTHSPTYLLKSDGTLDLAQPDSIVIVMVLLSTPATVIDELVSGVRFDNARVETE